jgi:hypothetical protein
MPARRTGRLAALVPRPYLPDRQALAQRLEEAFGERSLKCCGSPVRWTTAAPPRSPLR